MEKNNNKLLIAIIVLVAGLFVCVSINIYKIINNGNKNVIEIDDKSIQDKTTDLNRVTTLPTVTLTDDNKVSTNASSMPIYAWIDNNTIYYYTGAVTIDLNNN